MNRGLTVATDESFFLGEGPFWDSIRERLLWVDIVNGTVLVGTLRDDGTISIDDRVAFPTTVGAVAVSDAGDWIVAGGEELLIRNVAGDVVTGARILPAASGSRLNDGKPDPAGRYVVGSMCLGNDDSTNERLVVVQPDDRIDELDADLTLSNGLAWSTDGSVLYSIDTLRRTIYARPYDLATGSAGPRRILVTLDDGYPDGMCMDAEGHLWVAVWGLGQVQRYSPDGALVCVVDVPSPHTSCVTFAGVDLDTLVITTATQDLTPEQLAEFPLSGRLFTLDPRVRGMPQALWKGPTP